MAMKKFYDGQEHKYSTILSLNVMISESLCEKMKNHYNNVTEAIER
jgi:hypothetical protein